MEVTVSDALTRDLLLWIDAEPRTYAETMDAWRTHCPRLSIWEDALLGRLVEVRRSQVQLTALGREALGAA